MSAILPTHANESTPLLRQNGSAPREPSVPQTFSQRVGAFLNPAAHGEPGWLHSYKFFFFGSWLNILLIAVPLSAVAHYSNWDAGLRFSFSFIAIMPLAALLGTATDQLSMKLGQTLSGLLNASFGNAVEIIVGIAALLQDEMRIVQTSLLGSILSNLLLVLGCSFVAGGIYYSEGRFQATAAQAASSLMTLACITLVIPAAYHSSKSHAGGIDDTTILITKQVIDGSDLPEEYNNGLRIISRGTAILLLLVYIAYLFFQLKTHAHLFTPKGLPAGEDEEPTAEGARAEHHEEEQEEPEMSIGAAAVALLLVTVVTSFCADYLVASIEETAERYHIPKPFIGLILLPIVANAAEHVTSVWMAMKNKMELTIGICVGSSIQIAAFVVPLLVIVGWITHHDLTLFFADFETIVLFVSVLLVNFLVQDGKSNYMEGLMLLTLYLVIALACMLFSFISWQIFSNLRILVWVS
ncbi:Sodium/calcium exchanger protein-domain-containing protein [Irpex rosettiformis]|uniref:Sodium/calcium exchanger protein-domain-containing protein n=1 Tax=Irpex rosettiformis TaxID=378272 RepID=A0ACB8TVW4_9APHY|nr:Sodium/calcium exchanger protein-domain-containing protein [Irpex rosettiformis]